MEKTSDTDVKKHPTTHHRESADSIQEEILRRICLSFYAPGYQLKETVLAKEFGVSRTPVRDALARIAHLGLVETKNGVGTVVIALSEERIQHLYEVRMELASLIGKLSPAIIEQQHCDIAKSLHQQALSLREYADSEQYVLLNQQLQRLLFSLIGNSILRDLCMQTYYQASSVWHRMIRAVGSGAYEAFCEETSDLIYALERRDIEAVGYLQRIHIGYGYKMVQAHLLSEK